MDTDAGRAEDDACVTMHHFNLQKEYRRCTMTKPAPTPATEAGYALIDADDIRRAGAGVALGACRSAGPAVRAVASGRTTGPDGDPRSIRVAEGADRARRGQARHLRTDSALVDGASPARNRVIPDPQAPQPGPLSRPALGDIECASGGCSPSKLKAVSGERDRRPDPKRERRASSPP